MNTTVSATPASNLDTRLSRLRALLSSEGWSGLLVLDLPDIHWLTGLDSSNAALIVTPSQAVVVTDFRYVAEATSRGLDVRRVEQSLFGELGTALGEIVGGGPVAYAPGSLTHRAFLQLTETLPEGVTLRSAEGAVASLRRVKDAGELVAIRRAAELLDDAYAHLVEHGLGGKRERDVVWEIERVLREGGASAMSFDAIVAGGTNGAYPHHSPGDDVIPQDTLVTVDIGCIVDGYCSDCTRSFAVGSPSQELRRIYEVTLDAQQRSLAAVQPGAVGREVDAVAREIIDAAGYGEHFGHGLGHGVGLEIHEAPRLARTSSDVLEVGMVVTVEPGIYLPGVGGVRIEDLVVVTADGCEVLTNFPTEYTTVA